MCFHVYILLEMRLTKKDEWMGAYRKKYVEAVLADLPKENVHVNTPIKSVSPHDNGVTLVEESGRTHEYDYVIMA